MAQPTSCSICARPCEESPQLSPETGAPICRECAANRRVASADVVIREGEAQAMRDEGWRLAHDRRDARCTKARRCSKCHAPEVWVQELKPVVSTFFSNSSFSGSWPYPAYAGRTYRHVCARCGHTFVSDSTWLAISRIAASAATAGLGAVLLLAHSRIVIVCGVVLVLVGVSGIGSVIRRLHELRANPIVE